MNNNATEVEKQACGYDVKPHPDGQPWTKCCKANDDTTTCCQCFMKKPKAAPSRYEKHRSQTPHDYPSIDSLEAEGGRFFCMHRLTEDGFNRECAGWFAKIRSKFVAKV